MLMPQLKSKVKSSDNWDQDQEGYGMGVSNPRAVWNPEDDDVEIEQFMDLARQFEKLQMENDKSKAKAKEEAWPDKKRILMERIEGLETMVGDRPTVKKPTQVKRKTRATPTSSSSDTPVTPSPRQRRKVLRPIQDLLDRPSDTAKISDAQEVEILALATAREQDPSPRRLR